MLDKILFWVVLVWMIGMLVMAFIAVREVWRDADQPQSDAENPGAGTPGQPDAGKSRDEPAG
jgi:TRAP-type C4-dicarboxylate transport system permease small subunit